jgi:short-chain Z-isoprenyl diphosphate synthase
MNRAVTSKQKTWLPATTGIDASWPLRASAWALNTLKGILYKLYERRLLAEIADRPMPQHLGLIQDGHRRFARTAGLPDMRQGYNLGATKTEEVLAWCVEVGVPRVTLWWLSTENLTRDPDEVAVVLGVIEERLGQWIEQGLVERLGIRIRPIGKLDLLPASAIGALRGAEAATRHNTRLVVNVGVGYGGRQEIVDAVKGYLWDSFSRGESAQTILEHFSAEMVDKYLYTHHSPDPDLIIRTSGEVRLSGFMLWQSAFSEYYFCDVYWPAFRKIDFLRAIRSYQQRSRRFGR